MSKVKSKVLSVRLSLEDLQSCFDLCALAGLQPAGASSAIATSIKILMTIQRSKGILQSYTEKELLTSMASFVGKINPTTIASLERRSQVDLSLLTLSTTQTLSATQTGERSLASCKSLASCEASKERKGRAPKYNEPALVDYDTEEELSKTVEEAALLQDALLEERFQSERDTFNLSQEFTRELYDAIDEIEMEEEISLLSKILL